MNMNNTPEITTIDQYIAWAAPISQPILSEIKRVVIKAVPDATETISYKLPAFKLRRTFFYFAAFKNHIGVYPPVTDDPELISELLPYANEKGNLKFSLTGNIPYDLIARVAVALSKQY
jgi:uncharacterized protein YdhG (YjbR/CyaY superfamily)